MALLQARVKSILSGDTLVITNAKGAERTLSLAYISAPRLKREGDEVFLFSLCAFDAVTLTSASHLHSSPASSFENKSWAR